MMDSQNKVVQAFEFLRHVIQWQLNPTCKPAESAAPPNISWDDIFYLASRHGVAPLFYRSLIEAGSDTIPDGVLNTWKNRLRHEPIRNLFLAKELARIVTLLKQHKIPVLTLKGPALAQSVYKDINLRSYGDLDILVNPKNFHQVQKLLITNGYSPQEKLSKLNKLSRKLYLWQSGQLSFKRGANVFYVDLHKSVMPLLYNYIVDFEHLWRRSESISLLQTTMRTCGPEDMLLILCYHGAKNRWEMLKYACDVAAFITARPELDWDQVLRTAREIRGERILYIGLSLAHSLFDSYFPEDILMVINRDRRAKKISSLLVEKLCNSPSSGIMPFNERFRFQLAIQDTLFTRLRYSSFALLRRIISIVQPDQELL